MDITGPSMTDAISATQGLDNKQAQLQMLLLKKVLDAQQQQADELQKLTDGKGQNLDIRV
jgi:hypothetical protein